MYVVCNVIKEIFIGKTARLLHEKPVQVMRCYSDTQTKLISKLQKLCAILSKTET